MEVLAAKGAVGGSVVNPSSRREEPAYIVEIEVAVQVHVTGQPRR
ncbi:MAG: hypothetical protein ACC628_27145 [Pirellulaceae bacterium]